MKHEKVPVGEEIIHRWQKLCCAVLMRSLLDYHKWNRMTGRQIAVGISLGKEAESWIRQQVVSSVNIQHCMDAVHFKGTLTQFQEKCMCAATGDQLQETNAWRYSFYQEESAAESESSPSDRHTLPELHEMKQPSQTHREASSAQ